MRNWINRMLSDPQGVPDDGRILTFMAMMLFFIFEIYTVFVLKQPFSVTEFVGGFTGIGGASGIWFKVRGNT